MTEILYGVGAWPQVVAVSQYCSYPEDVKNKPRINGWEKTNLEQLTALKPDLVIGMEAQAPFLKDKLELSSASDPFFSRATHSLTCTPPSRSRQVTWTSEKAAELLTKTTKRRSTRYESRLPVANESKVLCVVDRMPGTIRELYTATDGSFLDELIAIAGGESVAPAAEHGVGKDHERSSRVTRSRSDHRHDPDSKGNFGEDPVGVWQELSEVPRGAE